MVVVSMLTAQCKAFPLSQKVLDLRPVLFEACIFIF